MANDWSRKVRTGRRCCGDGKTGQRVAELAPVDATFARNANRQSVKMTLADEVRGWMSALARPQLIGFSRDDRLLYARAGRAALMPAVEKILERNNAAQPSAEEIAAVTTATRNR